MFVNPDDHLWLRRETAADSARWEIWSPGVGPVAEAWLPVDLQLRYVGSGHPWGVRKNAVEVPYLERYSFR